MNTPVLDNSGLHKTEATALDPVSRRLVLDELDRMLSHPTFKKSCRCTVLLRHLVERALEDPVDQPKERALGHEVFGREPSYDTAADPIVRTTINEIRKRVSVYHHEAGPRSEARIELPHGSYLPQFLFNESCLIGSSNETSHSSAALELPPPRVSSTVLVENQRKPVKLLLIAWLVGLAVVTAIVLTLVLRPRKLDNSERFWEPFTGPANHVLICLPKLEPRLVTADAGTGSLTHLAPAPALSWPEAVAIIQLRSFFDARHTRTGLRDADALRLTDLKTGPVIFIGGIDNRWTTTYLSRLRYHIEATPDTGKLRIVDAKNPDSKAIEIDEATPFRASQTDYSIVSRFVDPNTGNAVMQLSGLGNHGTASAAEFVLSPKHLNALDPSIFSCGANLQFVLQTYVEDGSAGVPKVIATACW